MNPTNALADSTDLPQAVTRYLGSFTPPQLSTPAWQRLRSDVLALIVRCAPANIRQAKRLAQNLARLLAEELVDRPDGDLAALLTLAAISRHITRCQHRGLQGATVSGRRSSLELLHRHLLGLPAAAPEVSGRLMRPGPYRPAELTALWTALSPAPPFVRDAIACRLAAGLVGGLPHSARSARIVWVSGRVDAVRDAEGTHRPCATGWADALREAGVVSTSEASTVSDRWIRVWLNRTGQLLDWRRLRDAWLVELLSAPRPATALMATLDVTVSDIDRVLGNLPAPSCDQVRLLLRGPADQCPQTSVSADSPGTVPAEPASVGFANRDREAHRMTSTGQTTKTAKTRRPRVNKAQMRRLTAAHIATVAAPPAPLRTEQATYLEQFVPVPGNGADRERCRVAVVTVMERAIHIGGFANFVKHCSDVAALAAWADVEGRALDWTALMDHAVIHDFARQATSGGTAGNRGQRMNRLRTLASRLNPGPSAPPPPAPIPHSSVQPPYTSGEMVVLRRIAQTQPSAPVRRQLCAVVGLCRGAGASADELRHVRAHHLLDHGAEGILVTLGTGDAVRTVPVRRDWEDLVRIGVAGLTRHALVIGQVPDRRNVANAIVARAEVLGDAPRIDASRLRTTWIAELMTEPVPIQVILTAAGLRSARTLTDLLPLLAPTSLDQDQDRLRGEQR
jgi:hypothetical protein